MTAFPAHADRRARMFAVARELFARPNVEIALPHVQPPVPLAGARRAPASPAPTTWP